MGDEPDADQRLDTAFQAFGPVARGDVPSPDGAGLSKSATSRRFVALSAARMKAWMETRLDDLDLLVIQIEAFTWTRICCSSRRSASTRTATNIRSASSRARPKRDDGEGAHRRSRRAWTDPTARRLFIIDGSKALSKAIRRTFGRDAAIQRCQVHKARNILERLPKSMHVRCGGSCGKPGKWTCRKAETLIRNLARRLEPDWNGVSASILEGVDEMLTVTRLGLPRELRRSLAWTNIIENVMGTVRRVCRNVKYWRSPSMALRWAAAAMQEATRSFRRLKATTSAALRAALATQGQQPPSDEALARSPRLPKFQCATTASRISTDAGTSPCSRKSGTVSV